MKVGNGDTVCVECVMSAGGEVVFDSQAFGQPLSFTIGKGEVARRLEDIVLGMKPGEQKHTSVEDAFGPYREDLIWTVGRDMVEPKAQRVGAQVQVRLPQQHTEFVPATVREVSNRTIKLDANHPLAGKTIDYEVRLVEVEARA